MIQLLVIDDHSLMRQLLVEELNRIDGMKVLADFSTGEEMLLHLKHLNPDVILMDISLPGQDGIEITQTVRAKGIKIPILCLTMQLNSQVMARALKAGANGYVLKHDDFEELILAIQTVYHKQPYISPLLGGETHIEDDEMQQSSPDLELLNSLTHRERQILALIAEGKTSSEIAVALSISERTVDFHRRNLAQKTGSKRVAELTAIAIRIGLLT